MVGIMVNSLIVGATDFVMPSPSEFYRAQMEDTALQSWIAKHNSLPDSPFKPALTPVFDDTELWTVKVAHKRKMESKKGDVTSCVPQILVPSVYQRSVFQMLHDLCHPGGKSTFYLIARTHYWPGM